MERKKQLNALVDSVLLRRTKEGTIKEQLPKKSDFVCICDLSDLQLRAYQCAGLFWQERVLR